LKKLIIKGMDKRYFPDKIVEWYLENKRELPWRSTKDPYKIWLSEIILQQTRVIQGLPYYERFIQQYPSVALLAKAPEQEILRVWQGLGYYTRARNLHKCAKKVTESFNGKFPTTFSQLKELPGIGEYTAAAIASIAFQQPVAVVDGNVFRVLSRLYGVDTPINTPSGKKQFSALANELIQANKRPDLYNQAVMEFGATFCTPKNPSCEICPFSSNCIAFKNSLQNVLPVKVKRKESRKRYFHYVVFKKGKSLLMKKRNEKDIWNGLYDFPLIENEKPMKFEKLLGSTKWLKGKIKKPSSVIVSGPYKHILTHQTIFCRFVIIDDTGSASISDRNLKFYSYSKITQLPKPVLISRFLNDHAFSS
jgi:A/G-specific adenine glycosylase